MGRRLWSAHLNRPVLADHLHSTFLHSNGWHLFTEYAVPLGTWPISGPLLYPDANIGHLSVDRRWPAPSSAWLGPIGDLRRSFRRDLWPGRSADRLALLCPIQLFPAYDIRNLLLWIILLMPIELLWGHVSKRDRAMRPIWRDIVSGFRDWHPARADFPAGDLKNEWRGSAGLAICRRGASHWLHQRDTGAQKRRHGLPRWRRSRPSSLPQAFRPANQPRGRADFPRSQGRSKLVHYFPVFSTSNWKCWYRSGRQ